MVAEDILNSLVLDDITRSHAHIVSSNAEMLYNDMFKQYRLKYGLDSVVFSVTASEIGKMINVIHSEILSRRSVCSKHNVMRVSDLNYGLLDDIDQDIVKKLYLHVLLPRYMSNRNISTLIKLMSICIPMDIHLLVYHQADSKEENIEEINKMCYWTVIDDTDEIFNKEENLQ